MDDGPGHQPVNRPCLLVKIQPLYPQIARRNGRKTPDEIGIVNANLFIADRRPKGIFGLFHGIVIGALRERSTGPSGQRRGNNSCLVKG
jgi:hypothetical protein